MQFHRSQLLIPFLLWGCATAAEEASIAPDGSGGATSESGGAASGGATSGGTSATGGIFGVMTGGAATSGGSSSGGATSGGSASTGGSSSGGSATTGGSSSGGAESGDCSAPTVTTYDEGSCDDTVVYEQKLYKCISDHPDCEKTTGVYCWDIAPDDAAWGASAWQLLKECN